MHNGPLQKSEKLLNTGAIVNGNIFVLIDERLESRLISENCEKAIFHTYLYLHIYINVTFFKICLIFSQRAKFFKHVSLHVDMYGYTELHNIPNW